MNKVAFITGATRGIGKKIAIDMAKAGYTCIITGKSIHHNPNLPGTIYDVHQEIKSIHGGKSMAIPLDLRDENQMKEAVYETISKFGRIDCLIHNAGALNWKKVIDTTPKQYDLINKVNSRASLLLSSLFLPHMESQGYGHIIMHSPPLPDPNDIDIYNSKTAYMISKWGMTMTAMGIASEYKGKGIAANTIWPKTAIESYATKNNKLGTPDNWRKPDIISDAIMGIVSEDPNVHTGNQWIDEDYLRSKGETDFTKYQCVPGKEPVTLEKAFSTMVRLF
jgi:citronellol/citronellal dehydrogenase